MKQSIWMFIGMFAIVTALIIELTQIFLQTDPIATNTVTVNSSIILLFIGSFLFDAAYLDWKQEVNKILVLALLVIGLVGLGGSIQFWNALVDIFFPKTYIPTFLTINFMAIAVAGAFLPLFGRSLKRETLAP